MKHLILAVLLGLPLAVDGEQRPQPSDGSPSTVTTADNSLPGPVLRRERLAAILLEMSWQPRRPESAWQRMWNWVEALFRERGVDMNFDWLHELLDVPRSTMDWLSRLSIGAMALLALGIIVNEMRHGHWRRWRRAHVVTGDVVPSRPADALTLADVANMPTHEQPSAVLRCVLATLRGRGRPLATAGDTHRDIAAAATAAGDTHRRAAGDTRAARDTYRAAGDTHRAMAATGDTHLGTSDTHRTTATTWDTHRVARDTHRDIPTPEQLPAASAAGLVNLANMAERARFGGWQPKSSDGEEAVALGRAVLDQAANPR